MKTVILFAVIFLAATAGARAQESEIFIADGAAIRGYDPVAFFTDRKPVKGSPEISASFNGALWYFSSAANRDSFLLHPGQYYPQYGGYCAYGMAEGHKAPTQPETWTIVDQKLYFNYNQNVKKLWFARQKEFIFQADENWPRLKNKE